MIYKDLTPIADEYRNLLGKVRCYYGLNKSGLSQQYILKMLTNIVDKPFLRLDEPSDISGRLIFYVSELFILAEGGTDTSGMVAKYRDEFIPPILDDLSAFLENNNDRVSPKTERFVRVAYSDLIKLHSAHPNNRCIAEALSIYKQLPIVNQV